jgi:phosphogluconate dehydratase
MPELHKLTPYLSSLQDEGFQVALVTDGRMSGASGKVPAAIHLTPEALLDGPIGKIRNGDIIRLDAVNGELSVLVSDDEWQARPAAVRVSQESEYGTGRELFAHMRRSVSQAELGASTF